MGGIFYPEGRAEAEAALDAFGLEVGDGGVARAIVAPHAGWEISGKVAAEAFRAAAGRDVSTVVLVGPLHDRSDEGIFFSESDSFETPLGDVPVDLDLCAELESCGTAFVANDIPHLEEHSLEILLPFVKRCFPSASAVPVLIGGNRASTVRALSNALDLVFGGDAASVLFVVSTNLCAHVDEAAAKAQADAFTRCVLARDSAGLLAAKATGAVSACGAAACASLLGTAAVGGLVPRILAETETVGRSEGERKLVRYAAFAFD